LKICSWEATLFRPAGDEADELYFKSEGRVEEHCSGTFPKRIGIGDHRCGLESQKGIGSDEEVGGESFG
jgi:hypothetical protein